MPRRSMLVAACVLAPICAGCGGSEPAAPPPVYSGDADQGAVMGQAVPPVYLHLTAEHGAVLQRLSTRDDDWDEVCAAPCNGYVPAFGSYRVSLPEHEPTAPFTLPGPPGTRVGIKVDDEGNAWTTDSVQLRSQSTTFANAAAGGWLAFWMLRPK